MSETVFSGVRPARQAGRFYEGGAEELRDAVRGFIDAAGPRRAPGRAVALVAPHAGYLYSGAVAGAAYAELAGHGAERVLLLAPSHYVDVTGAALPAAGAFATPLGEVALDGAAAARLAGRAGFGVSAAAHGEEHSVEVQLPFLQVALERPFAMLPLVLGRTPPGGLATLSAPLLELLRERTAAGEDWLIVASTDTYHGYDRAACAENDERLADLIERLDTAGLVEESGRGRVMACGWMGLALAMDLARGLGASRGVILRRADSQTGRPSPGDYVVGYIAAALI